MTDQTKAAGINGVDKEKKKKKDIHLQDFSVRLGGLHLSISLYFDWTNLAHCFMLGLCPVLRTAAMLLCLLYPHRCTSGTSKDTSEYLSK